MKNTTGLLDPLTPTSEVHWLGGDETGHLNHYTGRDQLDAAINAGQAVYLGLIDYWYGDYDADYDADPGNLYYEAQENTLTGRYGDWVTVYEDTDYHGETKVVAVRLSVEVPDDVYEAFAAILAARPDPQPL